MSFVPISNFVRVDWESDLYDLTGFTSFITRIGRCAGGLEVIAISRSFANANPAARVHLRDAGDHALTKTLPAVTMLTRVRGSSL